MSADGVTEHDKVFGVERRRSRDEGSEDWLRYDHQAVGKPPAYVCKRKPTSAKWTISEASNDCCS